MKHTKCGFISEIFFKYLRCEFLVFSKNCIFPKEAWDKSGLKSENSMNFFIQEKLTF